ncbi:ubiquitin carboxyl-terminal hydrolase [Gongronella butleri]|nr:ubiquitin carboxyl-terminal hydrolase [Gongronella butleri]
MTRDECLEWLHIDPDPGLLTQLCVHLGIQGVQVEELLSTQRSTLFDLQPVYGIIVFLHHHGRPSKDDDVSSHDRLYFANQVINDAYAVHALLSIVLNCDDVLDLSQSLIEFKQFTRDFSPVDKGLSLGNSQAIRESQSKVARKNTTSATKDQMYHYISYVPFEGHLWELDGFKKGPARLGPCTDKNWLDLLHFELDRKTEGYRRQHVPYSIWTLIQDRRQVLQRKLVAQRYEKESIERNLDEIFPRWRTTQQVRQWEDEFRHVILNNAHNIRGIRLSSELLTYCQTINDLPEEERPVVEPQNSFKDCIDVWLEAQDKLLRLYNRLGQEDDKHEKYKNDTVRRQHDYLPFIKSYLEALHSAGRLQQLLSNETHTP